MNNKARNYRFNKMASPVGELTLFASDKGLVAVLWENDNPARVSIQPDFQDHNDFTLLEAQKQLNDYFDGKLTKFSVPLDLHGTDFQKKVWQALLTIPFGQTRSYADIAMQIGSPRAVRAVGAANGKNPLSIIAPCHRVIGSNGSLTGFAGGIKIKRHLLAFEGSLSKSDLLF